jgi:hypothetical protein
MSPRVTERQSVTPVPSLYGLQFISRAKFIPFGPLIIHVTATILHSPWGLLDSEELLNISLPLLTALPEWGCKLLLMVSAPCV